ncbi:MAG: YfbR-like 5'-deoxynucleotidase [Methyloligellaceae bacterium]
MQEQPPRAWQRMLSGRRLDLLEPSPADIEITDIAHGLARVARWNGQTIGDHAFSVAQHSLLVLEISKLLDEECSDDWRLATLLHDSAEYVVGDLISPFKAAIGQDYKSVENRLLAAIHSRFDLQWQRPDALIRLIKKADKNAAYLEAVNLAGFSEDEALLYFEMPTIDIDHFLTRQSELVYPWSADRAQSAFHDAFNQLSK